MITAAFFFLLILPRIGLGDKLVMRLISDPLTFDWNIASTTMDTYVLLNIMEGLVQAPNGTTIAPGLAEKWAISKDQKTYTFYLRKNVKWSDGVALTAQQFVDSWQRLLTPAVGAPYAYYLYDIVGAQDYSNGKEKDFSKVGIKALNASTFQVRLKHPFAHFLFIPTFWVTFPIRSDLILKHGKTWTNPANLVVLGPYKLLAYQPQHQIILEANPLYYGKRAAIDSVVMKIITENSTAINLYRSKQLDFLNYVNLTELGDLAKTKDLHTTPYYRSTFLGFNTSKDLLKMNLARCALSMAIDRSKFRVLFQGYKLPAETLVPPALLAQSWGAPFNPGQAKKLLAQAGVQTAVDLKKIALTLVADTTDENLMITQFLQEQWRTNLGLEVSIENPDFKTFKTRQDLLDGSIFLRRWGADYPDPDTYLNVFLSDSGNNRTGWKNYRYDSLVTKARQKPPGSQRNSDYKEALSILQKEECVIAPLYYDSQIYLMNSAFKGFQINPLNYIFLKNVSRY